MAEEDAEIALLHQMQAGQDNVAWDDDADSAGDGERPSNTTDHSDQQPYADNQNIRAISPSIPFAIPNADGGDYTPMSPLPSQAVSIASQVGSRPSSRASISRRPRTVGGFIADDSDEDEHLSSVSNSYLQQPVTGAGSRSISRSPLPTVPENNVVRDQALDISTATTPLVVGSGNVSDTAAQTKPTQKPSYHSVTTAGPKARLPHDRVGILEDRIKEDPRGDLDAWLSLIGEHRKRNKLDDARAVYDRFFKVFPSAVSSLKFS